MVDLKVVFEDETILVIDKPPHLISAQTDYSKEETVADLLQKKYGIDLARGGLAHRLDKDTSGLLLVAKTKQALENLQNQFKSRTIKKEYVALVHGEITEEGRIEASIARNPTHTDKFLAEEEEPDGRPSVTEYKPAQNFHLNPGQMVRLFPNLNNRELRKAELMRYGDFTLLHCFPQTGRTHQIRVHLKYINHPIVGDVKYTGRKAYRLDKEWCPRQFLHARKIEFNHPKTGERMNLTSPLAEDLAIALSKLETLYD